jgi:predicted transcriptional regulator
MASRYDEMESQLKTLTGSGVRSKIINQLQDGPKGAQDLASHLGASVTTILHALKTLSDDGTVQRCSGGYELTHVGQLKSLLLKEMIDGLAALSENEKFWQSHDISGIPVHLQARLGKLAGGICIEDEPNNLLKSQAVFIENVSKAKKIWGVSPIIAPGYSDMVTSLIDGGATVSLVLTTSIICIVGRRVIQDWLAMENFHLFEIPDGIKVAFTVTDDALFLGLYNLDGTYDALKDLVCNGQDAVYWGKELFEFYLKQSHPIRDYLNYRT